MARCDMRVQERREVTCNKKKKKKRNGVEWGEELMQPGKGMERRVKGKEGREVRK